MKAYLIKIIGAVLICVFTDIALPSKWGKYTKILTGLIMISAILSPINQLTDFDFFKGYEEIKIYEKTGEKHVNNLVKSELEKNIESDINSRIKEEFNLNITSDVNVGTNAENKISEIISVNLIGNITNPIVDRITEIYAPKEVLVNGF